MSNKVWRSYTIRFDGRPTLLKMQQELEHAAKSMHQYSDVFISTNGSADPDLEEITFVMENLQ